MKGGLSLYRDAARARGRTIGLYGGSFNPAHDGHSHIAKAALTRLGVDEVWLMVSPGNPLKDAASDMAPFPERLKSAGRIARPPRMRATDIEKRLGTRFTADTIEALKARMPLTRFVWLMGADNMASFDRWQRWTEIPHAVTIAIFDRPGYARHRHGGRIARRFGRFLVKPQRLVRARPPAWCFVTLPRHPASASAIRRQSGPKWYAEAL
ncbi:nicotinate-nucleotide adenylyltransferase [Gimibacter soli]|uniref:Probable nicotinate-nucleotide adenylyltransferase n=1 Tax=Gimibacter soli TaxID=3024400 RepID=A0AAE9XUL2_9PROT|nr:nicotinate-nucleotide adenylyltransferase [Gimibacter soli]WCL53883.1 nicotinate-nucleotide adenylyltransferase [Gimibacter soli]